MSEIGAGPGWGAFAGIPPVEAFTAAPSMLPTSRAKKTNPCDTVTFHDEVIASMVEHVFLVWGQDALESVTRCSLLKHGYRDYARFHHDKPYRVVVFDSDVGTPLQKRLYGGRPILVYNLVHALRPDTPVWVKMRLPLYFALQRKAYASEKRAMQLLVVPVVFNSPYMVNAQLARECEDQVIFLNTQSTMSPLYTLLSGAKSVSFQDYEGVLKEFVKGAKASLCAGCLSVDVPSAKAETKRHVYKCYELPVPENADLAQLAVSRGHWVCDACYANGKGTTDLQCVSPMHTEHKAMIYRKRVRWEEQQPEPDPSPVAIGEDDEKTRVSCTLASPEATPIQAMSWVPLNNKAHRKRRRVGYQWTGAGSDDEEEEEEEEESRSPKKIK